MICCSVRGANVLTKVMSGFQTGADRAGIHAAYALKADGYRISTGGWVPADRRANDGIIGWAEIEGYGLKVHPKYGYPPRTEANVVDSDGTVLFGNLDSPGCRLTIKCCVKHGKPSMPIHTEDFTNPQTCSEVLKHFIRYYGIETLNVAGNREETHPGIYAVTFAVVTKALLELFNA